MSSRTQRIEVFKDTQGWIQKNPRLSENVKKARMNSKVYYENEYPNFYRMEQNTEIVVTPS